MAKKYTEEEIRKMAVGLIEADMAADLDFDGKVTSADARYALRQDEGLKPMANNSLMADNILNKIIRETSSYSYDKNTDSMYSYYKELYEKQGDKAAEDALGLASALTGGYSNSYALMQAQAQKDKYNEKLAQKGEELEKQSYTRYLDSLDTLYSLYSLLSDAERSEEDKKNAALSYALSAYSVGDESFLEALGITPEKKEDKSDIYDKAELFAKYGDYSLLRELGVDVSSLDKEALMELGEYFAKYGDYSVLKSLGVNTDTRELEEYYDRLIKKYKVG